jgi:hypothetical protein
LLLDDVHTCRPASPFVAKVAEPDRRIVVERDLDSDPVGTEWTFEGHGGETLVKPCGLAFRTDDPPLVKGVS